MSLQELFQAAQMFKESITQASVARGISNAQEKINELNAAQMDELEKRNGLQSIANDLALNLSKTGAPVSQIQTAVQAVAPKAINTPNDAILQGNLAGPRGQALVGVGLQSDMQSAAPAFAQQKNSQDFQASENAKNRQMQLEIAGIRSTAGQNRLKPLSDKQIEFIGGIEDDIAIGQSLVSEVEKSNWLTGPAAGRIPGRGIVDERYAGFQQEVQAWFDQYRQRVTGAGASDTELERLKKSRPQTTDSVAQLRGKVNAIKKIGQDVLNRRMKTFERAGRDTRRFDYPNKGTDSAGQSQPQQQESTSVKLKGIPQNWLVGD